MSLCLCVSVSLCLCVFGFSVSRCLFDIAHLCCCSVPVLVLENPIDVVTIACGGEEVAHQSLRLVRSIYLSPTTRPIRLTVLHDDSPAIHLHLIAVVEGLSVAGMLDARRLQVRFVLSKIDPRMKSLFKLCSTARLLMARDLPDLDTVLYFDATDVFVLGDLGEMVQVGEAMGANQWAAMAWENELPGGWYFEEERGPFVMPYGVNAGTGLYSLSKWRRTNFTNFALHYTGDTTLGDQDILNAYFAQNPQQLHRLPCKWNYMVHTHCDVEWGSIGVVHGNTKLFDDEEPHSRNLISFERVDHFTLFGKLHGVVPDHQDPALGMCVVAMYSLLALAAAISAAWCFGVLRCTLEVDTIAMNRIAGNLNFLSGGGHRP